MKSEAMSDQRVVTQGAETEACLARYLPDPRRYDELLDEHGAVRAHWRALVERLTADKARDAARRALELTRRLIVENGVAYNVYSDPQGADRPWALDPLPLVLSQDEWRKIEKGVAQRARVLEALLADLYGPQRLLAEGLVPPELPFGHPNFLWPCHGLVPRGASWLHAYAADLARAPDGRWWLLADRTQAPSGAGYALENRDIVEQVLPEAIRDLGVRRVRDFFGEMRERLRSLFDDGANPLVVILTPGPFNETYFEHAYMARQLGLPLVEGHDLTVRNEIVYLKTLGGLKRVHTILRRLDDDYCDPVELRAASALGVPGLISAIRAQNVVITNALGTGVLESAAWLGFLPGDMREKVDPYLRPIYDALYDLMDARIVERALETSEIEIAPLAFMRGRTLSNAAVILDEAQNASSMQMKMFLTRLGENSRMIVTGDPSQVDLPQGQVSGLAEATRLLRNVEGVGIVAYTAEDVIRHELVGRIVEAYDKEALKLASGARER